MVAISRCLRSLALLVAGAECARISRKKKSANGSNVSRDCYSPYDGKFLLHLVKCTEEEWEGIHSHFEEVGCTFLDDHLPKDCSDTEVVCRSDQATSLEKRGLAKIVSSDAGASWRALSGVTQPFAEGVSVASDFYTAWRDLDAQMAHLDAVVQASGGVAALETAGQSLQGRDIKIVRFRGAGYVSGGTRLFATFNMHAREWITGMSGLYAVEQMIAKTQQDPNYLAGTEVVFMPMANPDGFYYSSISDRMHRKNMKNVSSSCYGVDLNRNWDAQWASGGSSGSPCSDTYHGTTASSEPETQVMARVMDEAQTTVYIDVHAYSQLIISSYGYTTATNPRSAEYRAMGGSIQSAIRSVGGNTWTEGPIAQVLYAASGSSVDYADKKGALGVCFELRPGRWGGGGFAPPARDILIGAQESYAGLLAALEYAKREGNPTPTPAPQPTPAPPPGTWVISGSGCEMDGNCIQSLNHPSNYGNNQQCSVELYGSIPLSVNAFDTERSYDILSVGGSYYSGTSGPSSGAYSGTITWSSDFSVTRPGWKLCRTD